MNRSAVKKFASWAQQHLLEQIAVKATQYGITENDIASPQVIGLRLNLRNTFLHVFSPELMRAAMKHCDVFFSINLPSKTSKQCDDARALNLNKASVILIS